MDAVLATLVKCLDYRKLPATTVIPWSSPIPSFGDLSRSKVATLGLNPSNREFVDGAGHELDGPHRRFHTLKSLGLRRWGDANARDLRLIIDSCFGYFRRNPYDEWFGKLDYVMSGTRASYYESSVRACHLDLVPYATTLKWTALANAKRMSLLATAGSTLGTLLRDSPVRLLILNGRFVVKRFEEVAGVRLEKRVMPEWSLSRQRRPVVGVAYSGAIRKLGGVILEREIVALGFNHNIQSSFGVTRAALSGIRQWIAQAASRVLS